jgi:hypothetical protein
MKRLLCLLLVLGMVGCGKKENAGNAVDPSIGADEQLVTDSGGEKEGPSNPNAEVATSTPAATDDPVSALEKLGAQVGADPKGQVSYVDSEGTQVTDAGPAGMKGYEGAPSYEKLRRVWPWMPGQQNYMSPRDARTKFLVSWNGAVRASYVDTNSPAQQELLDLAPYRLTVEFGSGMPPFFETTDQNQVAQRLGEGYQPIVISSWRNEQISCTSRFFCALFEADRVETGREMAVGFTRLEARNLGTEGAKVHLWMYLSTAQSPRWDGLTLLDDQGRVRLIIEPDDGVHVELHTSYDPSKDADNTQRDHPNWRVLDRERYLNNLVKLTSVLAPGESAGAMLKIPYFPVDREKEPALRRLDTEKVEQAMLSEWELELARGMQVEVPEPLINEVFKSNLMRIYSTAEVDPRTGLHHMKLHPTARYVASSESNSAVTALDQRGYHKEAEEYLDAWLAWQGTHRPDGEVTSQEGCLLASPEFEAVPWVSKNGQVLWMLCEHYKLSRDRAWLARSLPHILASADWIIRERNATKKLDERGNKVRGWGMMPYGRAGDYTSGLIIFSDAFNFAGLRSSAEVLAEIGHPRARELADEVVDYRGAIRDAVLGAVAGTPRVKLPSGHVIPWVPWDLTHEFLPEPEAPYGLDRDPDDHTKLGWARWASYGDVGPQTLAWAGVFQPDEDVITWTLQFAEEYPLPIRFPGLPEPHPIFKYGISYSQPLYNYQTDAWFWRDEIDKYVEAFYSLLAGAMSPKTYVTLEHRQIPTPHSWHYAWGDGEISMFIRRTLLAERGRTLHLLRGIPRSWLEDDKRIRVENAPTHFGTVSFNVHSRTGQGVIEATIEPPGDVPDGLTIELRLRHPENTPIQRVTIDGQYSKDFVGETVLIPLHGKRGPIRVLAEYAKTGQD